MRMPELEVCVRRTHAQAKTKHRYLSFLLWAELTSLDGTYCLSAQSMLLSVPIQLYINFASHPSYSCLCVHSLLPHNLVCTQDFVRMMYPNATESNVRQLMSMARDQKATYKVVSPPCHSRLHSCTFCTSYGCDDSCFPGSVCTFLHAACLHLMISTRLTTYGKA